VTARERPLSWKSAGFDLLLDAIGKYSSPFGYLQYVVVSVLPIASRSKSNPADFHDREIGFRNECEVVRKK
jgi:hypothetical protein